LEMEKIKLYYSSEVIEPWCDLKQIRSLLSSLKEKGVSVEEVDTAEIPEDELKEFYTSSIVLASIRKRFKISGIFGTRADAGCFFGREQPALAVFEEGTREATDVYPHDENGRRITIADFLREKISELE